MKKRKTYEISVIDKTYSKTISDETKFYTSDTALELVFKLKETEYTFESAEIVLLNIDDRSLVTRPVSKVNNDFVYELDDDITAHYGDWRGQLRFEDGEIYVSSPVKFRIENDLSNDRPPQLSDVQSWVSLKRYADSLTEELKQAVLSVDGIEDAFNTNETVRQSHFETAEQSRQTTFEMNESERDRTFESNETTRKAQELEREKAETQRQLTFEAIISSPEWESLTLINGATGWVKVRKKDDIVEVVGKLNKNGANVCFTVPQGFFNTYSIREVLTREGNWQSQLFVYASINSSGSFQAWHDNGETIFINIRYPIVDSGGNL